MFEENKKYVIYRQPLNKGRVTMCETFYLDIYLYSLDCYNNIRLVKRRKIDAAIFCKYNL